MQGTDKVTQWDVANALLKLGWIEVPRASRQERSFWPPGTRNGCISVGPWGIDGAVGIQQTNVVPFAEWGAVRRQVLEWIDPRPEDA